MQSIKLCMLLKMYMCKIPPCSLTLGPTLARRTTWTDYFPMSQHVRQRRGRKLTADGSSV